jgi:hypothetical protein
VSADFRSQQASIVNRSTTITRQLRFCGF